MDPQQKIIQFLADESQTPVNLLDGSTPLFGSVVFRSMLVLKLVAFLEKEFDIEIGADDLVPENFKAIETVATFVMGKVTGAPPGMPLKGSLDAS